MVDPKVTGMPTASLTRTSAPAAQRADTGRALRVRRQVSTRPMSNLSNSTPATTI